WRSWRGFVRHSGANSSRATREIKGGASMTRTTTLLHRYLLMRRGTLASSCRLSTSISSADETQSHRVRRLRALRLPLPRERLQPRRVRVRDVPAGDGV